MYAIIEDSGTQVKVSPGDVLELDQRPCSEGDEIAFDRVLMLGGDGPARMGTPYLEGVSVTGRVRGKVLGEKIDVIKFRRRTGYKRKTGHRQPYISVEITEIKQ